MSGLAHYFEDEGLSTVIVALVREHIVAMRPPRALWVPFELGRPFGAPGDAALQTRVLREALELLDAESREPLLRDFSEVGNAAQADPDWQPPPDSNYANPGAEVAGLLPAWQSFTERSGRSSFGISGFTPAEALEYIERYESPEPMPNPKGMAKVSRARFAIEDIKAFYVEAAIAGGGHPSSRQLQDWFWQQTRAGAMILEFQDRARSSEDRALETISHSLVPAERTLSNRVD